MNPCQANCCAIVVTFHPDPDFFTRLHALSEVFSAVVVIDNGSTSAVQQALLSRQQAALRIIINPHNLGLATALNQGLAFAQQQHFAWAMTFDQDTVVYPEILQTLSALYAQSECKPALLGSNYWHSALNRPFIAPNAQPASSLERTTLITSGTLLNLSLPAQIGYFREDYFIDSIDHEYCLRARSHGHRIAISTAMLMQHAIGNSQTQHRIPWLRIPEHPALRKYYITRNCLTTVALYARQEPRWALRQVLRLAVECLAIVIYETRKPQKLAAMGLGCLHALTGQLGQLALDNRPWLK